MALFSLKIEVIPLFEERTMGENDEQALTKIETIKVVGYNNIINSIRVVII